MIYDVCVVGAGASGLCAAICAARQGARVLLLEKMNKAGRKILATGNGRCNLSNRSILKNSKTIDSSYRASDMDFVHRTIASFDMEDALVFFRTLGLETCFLDEYIYPASMQAFSVREALSRAVSETKLIELKTWVDVLSVKPPKSSSECFTVNCSSGDVYSSRKLILAAGGKSAEKYGSGGRAYRLAEELGHSIVPVVPALCPLKCREGFLESISGVRCRGKVSLYIDSKFCSSDTGEVQFTSYGISGIPVFQISRFASYALERGEVVKAKIDLLPDLDADHIKDFILEVREDHPLYRMWEILSGLLNDKLAKCIVEESGRAFDTRASAFSMDEIERITELIKNFEVHITEHCGFENSQVSAGGVSLSEIDPADMSSKTVPGLYICGEMMDVDGICGGFNLHWAWATGCIAGSHAGRREDD